MKEENPQEEEKEGKGTIEEVVTPPDESELLLAKRVLFGIQKIEEEPKEIPFHIQKEKTIISAPLIPSKFPQKSTQNKLVQLNLFHSLNKPC